MLLAMSSVSWLTVAIVTTKSNVHWGPEQWVPIIAASVTSLGAIVTGTVSARRSNISIKHSEEARVIANEIITHLRLPSNGVKMGALMEGVTQVQHISTQILTIVAKALQGINPDEVFDIPDIPSAMDIARALETLRKERELEARQAASEVRPQNPPTR